MTVKPLRWLIPATAFALLATGTPARSEDGLDKHTMETFGGTYVSDCANNAAPRLTIFQDALVYLEGKTRIAGSKVMTAASYYGENVAETYRFAILSEPDDQSQLIFVVHEDAEGYYVVLDGDTKVMAKISAAMKQQKFRRCGVAPAKPAPAKAAAPAPPNTTGLGVTASGMFVDRKFKAAYHKALGPRVKEPWLALLDGPSVETKKVQVAGAEYFLIVACMNHDCYDNNTVLLWSAPRKLVYGLIHQAGRTSLIGAPTSAIATKLRALWKAQWRANE